MSTWDEDGGIDYLGRLDAMRTSDVVQDAEIEYLRWGRRGGCVRRRRVMIHNPSPPSNMEIVPRTRAKEQHHLITALAREMRSIQRSKETEGNSKQVLDEAVANLVQNRLGRKCAVQVERVTLGESMRNTSAYRFQVRGENAHQLRSVQLSDALMIDVCFDAETNAVRGAETSQAGSNISEPVPALWRSSLHAPARGDFQCVADSDWPDRCQASLLQQWTGSRRDAA